MADTSESLLATLCGGCGLVILSALEPWCNTKAFGRDGCGCCGGPRGCCGSCFDGGFDKDSWEEEEEAKKRAANQDGATQAENGADRVDTQPEAVPEMKAAASTDVGAGAGASAKPAGERDT